MEPIAPTINPTPSNDMNKKQNSNDKKWVIATISISVVAVLGIGFGIFQMSENGKRDDEISALKDEVEVLKQQSQQANDGGNVADKNEGSTHIQKYLEPEGWDVRFAYPKGVTDVEYSMNENFDGTLYIDSITKDGKVYNVDVCGGKEAYGQYPFFLGTVQRWNPDGQHESWNTSPADFDGEILALTNNGLEYYVNSHYGNGCEIGETTADYVEALRISKELLGGIEAR